MKNFEFCQENSIFWYFVGYNIQEYYWQKIDFSEFVSVCFLYWKEHFYHIIYCYCSRKKEMITVHEFFYKFEEKALL